MYVFSLMSDATENNTVSLEISGDNLKEIANSVSDIGNELMRDGASFMKIKEALDSVRTRLSEQGDRLIELSSAGDRIVQKYRETENVIKGLKDVSIKNTERITSKSKSTENISGEIDDDTRKVIDIIKSALGMISKSDDDYAKNNAKGLKGLISYCMSLYDFIKGEKTGYVGTENLLDVVTGSASLWKAMYDIVKSKYEHIIESGAGQGLFSNKGIIGDSVGIFGDSVSLLNKYIKAATSEHNTWMGKTGEYMDAGGDAFGIIQSSVDMYKVVHGIKNTSKGGLYSAAGQWAIFADTCFSTAAQAFKSVEKYSADGVWDINDTGATLVDSSVSGLWSMFDGLTFGLLGNVTGGDPEKISSDMQGWAAKTGKDIGHFILRIQGKETISSDRRQYGIYDFRRYI